MLTTPCIIKANSTRVAELPCTHTRTPSIQALLLSKVEKQGGWTKEYLNRYCNFTSEMSHICWEMFPKLAFPFSSQPISDWHLNKASSILERPDICIAIFFLASLHIWIDKPSLNEPNTSPSSPVFIQNRRVVNRFQPPVWNMVIYSGILASVSGPSTCSDTGLVQLGVSASGIFSIFSAMYYSQLLCRTNVSFLCRFSGKRQKGCKCVAQLLCSCLNMCKILILWLQQLLIILAASCNYNYIKQHTKYLKLYSILQKM